MPSHAQLAVRAAVAVGLLAPAALAIALTGCAAPHAADLASLAAGQTPGFVRREWGGATWIVPDDDFFAGERNPAGVWVRGGVTTTAYVVSAAPLDALRLILSTPFAEQAVSLDGGGDRVRVRFDSEGKRGGTPIVLPLAEVAHDVGFLKGQKHEHVYRVTIESATGWVPGLLDADNRDGRYLGVFLNFGEEGR
jgi:hypothetical protein